MEVGTNQDSCREVHLTTMLMEKYVKKKKYVSVIREAGGRTMRKGQHSTDTCQCLDVV